MVSPIAEVARCSLCDAPIFMDLLQVDTSYQDPEPPPVIFSCLCFRDRALVEQAREGSSDETLL